jgi:hypothetical protein
MMNGKRIFANEAANKLTIACHFDEFSAANLRPAAADTLREEKSLFPTKEGISSRGLGTRNDRVEFFSNLPFFHFKNNWLYLSPLRTSGSGAMYGYPITNQQLLYPEPFEDAAISNGLY